jgi:acyl dehydratase
MKKTYKYYWEDFPVGSIREFGGITLSKADTLRVRFTVLEARPLESKPTAGLLRSHWDILNQKDECMAEMERGVVSHEGP